MTVTPGAHRGDCRSLAELDGRRKRCAGACGNSDTRLSIASSFGAEDVVLIDMASRLGQPFRVFTLDTDFLFPETYALIDVIEERYGHQGRANASGADARGAG